MQGNRNATPGVVIVGAGQAGARAAEAVRGAGYAGTITLIGAEAHMPYERPQLSKATLLEDGAPVIMIRDGEGWRALGVDVVPATRIVTGDAGRHVVVADDGREFPYDKLLIATGTTPRRLPAVEAGPLPVLPLRSIEDAQALRRHLAPGVRVAIVGGGVIGLEVAAAAVKAGATATVIEAAPGLLARALPPVVADFVKARHEREGVTFRLGRAPVGQSAAGVEIEGGETVPADVIVVGIGVEPELALARSLGAEIDQGILVDECGRTSVADVFAAGDVASRFCPWNGRVLRIETWANAQNQAAAAARTMVGEAMAYRDPPWFWSDQYDLNIQVVGHAAAPGTTVLRGDPATGRFSALTLAGGTVIGAVTVNAPKDMASLRRLVAAGRPLSAQEAGDTAFDLRKAATR
ncbi:NAD(P)/FAD-dependent oxidoreductase [Zavarzinia aquatilis]|nr:FAD-dependent oxidoreductase [Zavarzinia aquatilis]